MEIEVENLTEAGEPFAHTYEPGELALEDTEVRLRAPAEVAGRASRKREEVRVRGHIRGEVEAPCDRCLAPVGVPLDIEFDTAFAPAAAQDTVGENTELQAEDLRLDFYEGETINLDELVREQILLALPTRLLCREECRGLCPQCGADLNAEGHVCERQETDPRWAALADLRRERE